MKSLTLCAALAATVSLPLAAQESIALRCGQLLDVEGSKVLKDTTVVVRGGAIESVGGVVPDGATVIDLTDHTCSPGFMDMHVHLAHESGFNPLVYQRSSAWRALKTLRNAQAYLNAGFTTLRSTGGFDRYFETVEVRNAINRGEFDGPRMFVAPKGIAGDGGVHPQTAIDPEGVRPPDDAYIMNVVGVVEARRAAAKEIRHGGDWIKLIDAEHGGLTLEEMKAIVDQAHRMGARVTTQTGGDLVMVKQAVEAGVDSVEHALFNDPELLARMARDGVFLVPTIWIGDFIGQQEPGYELTPDYPVSAEMVFMIGGFTQYMKENTAAAHKAGIKLALGTDFLSESDTVPLTAREFRLLSEALGGDNWVALQAGTINSAELLGMEAQIGSITAGKYADIVAMPDNPVEDITATERVSFVMKGGKIIRQ